MEQKYIDLFWNKVDKTDSCWNWTAYTDRDGYGIFGIRNIGQFRAHRFSVMLTGQDLPKDKIVLHHCNNPSCVNPSHLSIGTIADNNLDKLNKNRQAKQKGVTNAMSKLTEAQVKDIRNRCVIGSRVGYNNGSNVKELASEYKVCVETIRLIAKNKIWSHI